MLPDPPRPRQTTRLARLAAGLDGDYPSLASLPVANLRLPLKTPQQVFDTIVRGDIASLRALGALEWMMFLTDQAWWRARQTLAQEVTWIARAASYDQQLLDLTLSCVAFATFGGGFCAPELISLARSGRLFERSPRAALLAELLDKNVRGLSARCRRNGLAPEDLIGRSGFPLPDATHLDQIRRACFGKRPDGKQQDFYLQLLEPLRLADIEHAVLLGWNPEDSDEVPRVRDWLVEYFDRHGEEGLSARGRERLQAWRGSTHFDEFQQVARLLEERASELQFSSFQLNQLKSRVSFWSTFRDSFRGVQFLFPPATHDRLARWYPHAQKFDGEVEVCLFDFGDHTVVEVLRSRGGRKTAFDGGETRLLASGAAGQWYRSGGGLRELRRQQALLVHDHKVRWQQGLFQALQHFDITPLPKQKYTNYATRDGSVSVHTASFRMGRNHLRLRRRVFMEWVDLCSPPVHRGAYPSYLDG